MMGASGGVAIGADKSLDETVVRQVNFIIYLLSLITVRCQLT